MDEQPASPATGVGDGFYASVAQPPGPTPAAWGDRPFAARCWGNDRTAVYWSVQYMKCGVGGFRPLYPRAVHVP